MNKAKFYNYTPVAKSLIECQELDATEFRLVAVLDSLCFFNKIFPSQAELAQKTACSVITIKRKVKSLQEKGIIAAQQRRNQDKYKELSTNEYSFVKGGWDEWYHSKYGDYQSNYKSTAITSDAENSLSRGAATGIIRKPYESVYTPNELLYSDRITSGELRVYLYLMEFEACESIYPSLAMIGKKINQDRKTILMNMASLEVKGLLRKSRENLLDEKGKFCSNIYEILNFEELKSFFETQESRD